MNKELKRKTDWGLWKRLLKFARPHKNKFLLLAFYMVCLAVLESLAPLFSKYAIDNFIMPGKIEGLVSFSLVYFVVIVLQMAVIWLFIEMAGRIKTIMSPCS